MSGTEESIGQVGVITEHVSGEAEEQRVGKVARLAEWLTARLVQFGQQLKEGAGRALKKYDQFEGRLEEGASDSQAQSPSDTIRSITGWQRS
jgi:hypothetical protein